jgi:hypothetical protein
MINGPRFGGNFSFFSGPFLSQPDWRKVPGSFGQGCFGPADQPDGFLDCDPKDDAQVATWFIDRKIPFNYTPTDTFTTQSSGQ